MLRNKFYRFIPGSASRAHGAYYVRLRVSGPRGPSDLVVTDVREAQEMIEALGQFCVLRGAAPFSSAPRGMIPMFALWLGMRRKR